MYRKGIMVNKRGQYKYYLSKSYKNRYILRQENNREKYRLTACTSLFYYSGGFMTQSPDITKLAQAMLIVQQQLQPAIKDAKNPFIGNEYATLNSVMES